jgi:L-Ala-D/L-Glu epimerase
MTIKSITVYKKNLALTRPYTIATNTISDVESVFVDIALSNGIIGLGAANPAKEVVGEDADMSLCNLQSDDIQRFVGRDIAEIFSILPSVSAAFPHAPGTLAAMDIALHDAFCQYLKLPIAQFYGQKIKSMPTSVTIGIKNVADTLEEADEYWDAGFRVLKVKLGHDMAEDIERLVKLREKFGQSMRIRVDANQGYQTNQVVDFFTKTKHLNIELVEQPTPVGQEKPLLTLPYNIRKQIAADESLVDLPMALFLAGTKRVGIFNIKLMKCGGIHEALKIATIAEAANVDLFWGCNDESIVSISAALHAAFSCAHTKYIDLDGSLDLAEDVVKSGFVLKNGVMSLNSGAGLGLIR